MMDTELEQLFLEMELFHFIEQMLTGEQAKTLASRDGLSVCALNQSKLRTAELTTLVSPAGTDLWLFSNVKGPT